MTKSTITTQRPMGGDSVLLRALQSRKTDQLFSVSDYDILTELHPALSKIKQMLNDPAYVDSQHDQQVVELVFLRITAAIRETNFIEGTCPALIDLLDLCLNHYMTTVHGSQVQDSPHCKIVLEILNTLFLNHNKQSIMALAIPGIFNVFERTDSESLVNAASSYLSLAAIHNGKILSRHSLQLVKNILKGHHCLVSILPHVYLENSQPFNAHLIPLFNLLYTPSLKIGEKLSLLQFLLMVTNKEPDLIISHLSELDSFLLDPSTCSATLQIFLSLINNGQLIPIRRAAQKSSCSPHNLLKMVKIVASIALHSEQLRIVSVSDIVCIFCPKLFGQPLLHALREVEEIAELFPHVVQPHVTNIQKIAEQHPAVYGVYIRIKSITSEVAAAQDSVNLRSVINYLDSIESLASKRSSHAFPSDPAPLNEQERELDRNIKNLAMRSTNSLGQPKSRSFLSLTAPPTNRMPCSEETCNNCHNQTTPRVPSETKSANRHSLISNGVPFVRPQPQAEKVPLPPIPANIQLGRDGRVRPVAQHRFRNPWATERDSTSTTTTTFPVFSGSVKRNTLSGSQIKMVDEHAIAVKSRQHSSDTLAGRTSRNTSDQIQNPAEPLRDDVVRQFISNHRSQIINYILKFSAQYPIPVKCSVEGPKGGKSRMLIHFACQSNDVHCLFNRADELFAFKTKSPETWLHLMFLHVEVAHIHLTGKILDQSSVEFRTLSNCWFFLPPNITKSKKFSNVVISQFPNEEAKLRILKELQKSGFFESFTFDGREHKWVCNNCANPEKFKNLVQTNDQAVLIEGQLKQKKNRFWFNSWNNRYFRLSGKQLTCAANGSNAYHSNTYNGHSSRSRQAPIDLSSVRSLSRGKKNRKALASTFEIQTDNNKYVLKAKDRNKADEWYNYLQMAISQAKQQHQLTNN